MAAGSPFSYFSAVQPGDCSQGREVQGVLPPSLVRAAAPARGSTPTAAALRAPRSDELLRESGPPPRSLSFSSTTAAGKRKRKRLRGGPRPSAVNAERGLAARGRGSGLRPAGGRLAGRSPMPPRGRKRARCARLGGPVPGRKAGSPAARGEAPQRAFVRPRGPPSLARPMRTASPAAPQSAPAWASGLMAALRGFLP